MKMPFARVDEDLFIEPPSDEDLVYGDYNNTMDGSSSTSRPYIRMTDELRNMTRNAGGEVRMRCEAVGTLPIQFTWLKSNAPIEKSRRVKIRHKESFSRLTISNLDVLDSAFYTCIASNSAGTVNSTSVFRVKHAPEKSVKGRPSISRIPDNNDEDYDDYDDMEHPRGRLPHEEDSDLYRVPDDAAGPGYAPTGPGERWLDDVKIKEGDCVLYRGEACRSFLAGRNVRITTSNREEMYDIDRNLKAAMMFIDQRKNISPQCKRVSHAVACFHMYKVCDVHKPGKTQTICKADCDELTNEMCPAEMAEAANHDLVGEGSRALFPNCSSLPTVNDACIPVLRPPSIVPSPPSDPSDMRPRADHWCYTESGKNYLGMVAETSTGKRCQDWKDSVGSEFSVNRYEELRYAGNYCRNPGGSRPRPWCYAAELGTEEYCNVPQCPPDLGNSFEGGKGIGRDSGGSLPAFWLGLGPSLQIGLLVGGVALGIILLCILCACCCRRKSSRSSDTKQRSPPTAHSLPTTINSAPQSVVNTAYYRKLNGTSTPMTGRGGVEMGSLLSGGGRGPAYPESEAPYHVTEIQANQITGMRQIGEGQFSEMLHYAVWNGSPTGQIAVAVKCCRSDANQAMRVTLEEEIRRVASLSHPNVLGLLGVSFLGNDHIMAAVYEYAVRGCLLTFAQLRQVPDDRENDRERETHIHDFLSFAIQISAGMEYLAVQGMVHRDLAARNVLVCEVGQQVKIADLAHLMPEFDLDYVKMAPRSRLPFRWMAKEALESGRYSEKSDVWAYGVTLWEMYSYGRTPYETYSNQQVSQLVNTRQLLETPQFCPTNMYSLMVECWHEAADRRPSFGEIHRRLQTWAAISPAHSLMQGVTRGASSSSHSGSSNGRMGTRGRGGQTMPGYPQRVPRRNDDASPLMGQREAAYEYSEDGDSE